MELTVEERAVLAHVVIDPDTWVTHALANGGETVVIAKINRWRSAWLAAKDLPGYMTRAQRDAYKSPEQIAEDAAFQAAAAARKQAMLDSLPSWLAVSNAIDAADTLAKLKVIVKKLARVVYWLAKDSGI